MHMSEVKAAHEPDDGQIDLEFNEEAQEVEIDPPSETEETPPQAAQVEEEDEHENIARACKSASTSLRNERKKPSVSGKKRCDTHKQFRTKTTR